MKKPALRIVSIRVVVCQPWHIRDASSGANPIGKLCWRCGRDVALPRAMAAETPICLYCGMDVGIVPLVEVEP